MNLDAILSAVASHRCRHVVVTGGEPMIARDIATLLAALREAGHHITIETAATIPPPNGLACDLASLSPKLGNSTPSDRQAGDGWSARHETRRYKPGIIREWIERHDYQLKYVVSSEADVEEIAAQIANLGLPVPPERVLLMPEGIDPAALARRGRWLVDICKRTGYRFCPRLHIDLFGHTRGT